MYCRLIACDFDGTIALDGHLAPEAAAALARARSQGMTTILVTGRVLEDVRALCPDWTIFDALVAENGAVVWFPDDDCTIQLGAAPSERLLTELRSRGVPFHVGAVVVGTWDRHIAEVTAVIRQVGVDAQLILNRSALMILPSGITKATGVARVLEELGGSAHNMIAFGDAENDFPLLALAELGVAAADAVAAVAAAADDRVLQPGGGGIAHYIHGVLDAGGVVPTPARHRIVLGHDGNGAPVSMPAGVNVMISGDPRSGKSWIAGRVGEELLDHGYQVCIVDPEGDHVGLEERPHVLVLGQDLELPKPSVVPRLLRETSRSIVLTLTGLPVEDQVPFVRMLLSELEAKRAASGLPHWILVDEAQYFFQEAAPGCGDLARPCGNFILLTYRPSLIAPSVCNLVQAHLITRTTIEEERYFISALLRTCGPEDLMVADALAGLEMPHAGLLLQGPAGWRWQAFSPSPRVTHHTHHARKYVDQRLPDSRAFHFLQTDDTQPLLAHDIKEFHAALLSLPPASLQHHLARADFSRWANDVLNDPQLASSLRKLERLAATGATVDPWDIVVRIEAEYGLDPRARPRG